MTLCGLSLPDLRIDKEEALARGGEHLAQGYPLCLQCLEAERLLRSEGLYDNSRQHPRSQFTIHSFRNNDRPDA